MPPTLLLLLLLLIFIFANYKITRRRHNLMHLIVHINSLMIGIRLCSRNWKGIVPLNLIQCHRWTHWVYTRALPSRFWCHEVLSLCNKPVSSSCQQPVSVTALSGLFQLLSSILPVWPDSSSIRSGISDPGGCKSTIPCLYWARKIYLSKENSTFYCKRIRKIIWNEGAVVYTLYCLPGKSQGSHL